MDWFPLWLSAVACGGVLGLTLEVHHLCRRVERLEVARRTDDEALYQMWRQITVASDYNRRALRPQVWEPNVIDNAGSPRTAGG